MKSIEDAIDLLVQNNFDEKSCSIIKYHVTNFMERSSSNDFLIGLFNILNMPLQEYFKINFLDIEIIKTTLQRLSILSDLLSPNKIECLYGILLYQERNCSSKLIISSLMQSWMTHNFSYLDSLSTRCLVYNVLEDLSEFSVTNLFCNFKMWQQDIRNFCIFLSFIERSSSNYLMMCFATSIMEIEFVVKDSVLKTGIRLSDEERTIANERLLLLFQKLPDEYKQRSLLAFFNKKVEEICTNIDVIEILLKLLPDRFTESVALLIYESCSFDRDFSLYFISLMLNKLPIKFIEKAIMFYTKRHYEICDYVIHAEPDFESLQSLLNALPNEIMEETIIDVLLKDIVHLFIYFRGTRETIMRLSSKSIVRILSVYLYRYCYNPVALTAAESILKKLQNDAMEMLILTVLENQYQVWDNNRRFYSDYVVTLLRLLKRIESEDGKLTKKLILSTKLIDLFDKTIRTYIKEYTRKPRFPLSKYECLNLMIPFLKHLPSSLRSSLATSGILSLEATNYNPLEKYPDSIFLVLKYLETENQNLFIISFLTRKVSRGHIVKNSSLFYDILEQISEEQKKQILYIMPALIVYSNKDEELRARKVCVKRGTVVVSR
ncbi:MAG: hypothetical protein LBJ93_02575 [Clostridiales bacterium]|jgi:hypothetical protein|nr:hypothetical protein [Clostridiales bacterium]